jgi:hypothetical protein
VESPEPRAFVSHTINVPAAKIVQMLNPLIAQIDKAPGLSEDEYELLHTLLAYRDTMSANARHDGVQRKLV